MTQEFMGKKVFIQTVTYFFTGEVVAESKKTVTLKNAAWVANTGRLTDALAKEEFSEVELFPKPYNVCKASIVGWTEIDTLPSKQK